MTTTVDLSFEACDRYMAERTGSYEWRAVRYRRAGKFMASVGLQDSDTLCDVGAGWTELDYCLRTEFSWRGRYMPLDAGLTELDLETWVPQRPTEHVVALELLEHLQDPERLVRALQACCRKSFMVSVPNPRTTDVFAMDPTHQSEPDQEFFERLGFQVQEATFYGGVYSAGRPDALFATWTPR